MRPVAPTPTCALQGCGRFGFDEGGGSRDAPVDAVEGDVIDAASTIDAGTGGGTTTGPGCTVANAPVIAAAYTVGNTQAGGVSLLLLDKAVPCSDLGAFDWAVTRSIIAGNIESTSGSFNAVPCPIGWPPAI